MARELQGFLFPSVLVKAQTFQSMVWCRTPRSAVSNVEGYNSLLPDRYVRTRLGGTYGDLGRRRVMHLSTVCPISPAVATSQAFMWLSERHSRCVSVSTFLLLTSQRLRPGCMSN